MGAEDLLSAYMTLPADLSGLVDIAMTKGEGAPILLKKLDSLFSHENDFTVPVAL
jgi:hypothetical protein